MKKSALILFFISAFLCQNAYGFEIKGLQPVDPYGIFSVFSAESLPKGKVSVSPGLEVSVDPDLYRSIFKMSYGLTERLELNVSVPYEFGSDIPDGFEDIALGLKHRFFEERKYGPSLAYIVTASLPAGSEQLTTDGRYGIGLIISKRVGPVNGHLNLFYLKPGSSKFEDEASFSAGLDFAAANNFKLLGELYCRKSHNTENVDTIEGRIGYRIRTTDSIYTTFGAGFDLKNRTPETRIMFAVTFLSPKEKKKIQKIYEEE